MIANGSSLVSLITDKDYDRKIAGYLNVVQDDCRRRLYAILKANLLFMFKSAESLEIPLLLIIMEDCVVELADDNSTGMEHSFVIRTGQTYVMATENQEQLKNWISLLTSCSIEFMRATKESLELEHDNRDDEQKEQEKKKHES
ncbi:PH domain-containing protein [Meloidogyne graminicola]|uniref:PH domain-containing protein n=1 Tax=Meloidogyne graminicola TaxID=189291 RepID=A0A8S9ZE67_9BILA|nr:PH domain-containing protein [Meloidogyne graminicola]